MFMRVSGTDHAFSIRPGNWVLVIHQTMGHGKSDETVQSSELAEVVPGKGLLLEYRQEAQATMGGWSGPYRERWKRNAVRMRYFKSHAVVTF